MMVAVLTRKLLAADTAAAGRTAPLDVAYLAGKTLFIRTVGFSGTLDIQGSWDGGQTWVNLIYWDMATEVDAQDAQLTYTTNTSVSVKVLDVACPLLSLLTSRTAGSITAIFHGSELALTMAPASLGGATITATGSSKVLDAGGTTTATVATATSVVEANAALAVKDPSVGFVGDAIVAAGATGSLSAKLRRVTQALADLTAQVGEVQSSPTANTLLDRLKQLLTGISLAAGTALIGKVALSAAGGTAATQVKLRNVNATPQVIKAGPGTLYGLSLVNAAVTAAWVQVFNLAAPAPGTDTPDREYFLPAGSGLVVPLPAVGVAFTTAITVVATTLEAGSVNAAAGVHAAADFV